MRCAFAGSGVGMISTSNPNGLNFETSNSSSFLSFPGGLLVSTWITSDNSAAALEAEWFAANAMAAALNATAPAGMNVGLSNWIPREVRCSTEERAAYGAARNREMLGYEFEHALSNSCVAAVSQRRRENGLMNVVVYGATGKTGSRVVQELLSRGHQLTAVVRDLEKASSLPRVTQKQDDLSEVSAIAEIIRGADAVVSAYAPPPDHTDELVEVTKRQIEAVKQAGNDMRLIVVGGAAGLYVAPGLTLLESGHLPEVWRSIATSHFKALAVLQGSDINWTYFAPAAFFEPGERTGKFRLGTDHLISDSDGQSRISMEDYAIALVDELERPEHLRQRFTVGY